MKYLFVENEYFIRHGGYMTVAQRVKNSATVVLALCHEKNCLGVRMANIFPIFTYDTGIIL